MSATNLGEELIEEILTKLPAKSLMRFKCLSRAYGALITSNRFITKHFSHSTLATENQPNLLVFHFTNKFSITLVFGDELLQPPIDLISQLHLPEDRLDTINAYGPCNGIFCLEVSMSRSPDQLMLWNPATREVKPLPLPLTVDCSTWKHLTIVHGFGFDAETNDYKVVNIVSGEEEGLAPLAQVYNLRTNTWRMAEVTFPAKDIVNPIFTSYLNEVFHWLAKSNNERFVFCFGMTNNMSWRMNLPSVSEGNANQMLVDCNLAILKESLSYIKEYRSSSTGNLIEVWVMNVYGVEESWTRRFTIGPFHGPWKFWGFLKYNEVFLVEQDGNLLVSYNVDTQQPVRQFPVDVRELSHLYRYEESVVSLSILAGEQ